MATKLNVNLRAASQLRWCDRTLKGTKRRRTLSQEPRRKKEKDLIQLGSPSPFKACKILLEQDVCSFARSGEVSVTGNMSSRTFDDDSSHLLQGQATLTWFPSHGNSVEKTMHSFSSLHRLVGVVLHALQMCQVSCIRVHQQSPHQLSLASYGVVDDGHPRVRAVSDNDATRTHDHSTSNQRPQEGLDQSSVRNDEYAFRPSFRPSG